MVRWREAFKVPPPLIIRPDEPRGTRKTEDPDKRNTFQTLAFRSGIKIKPTVNPKKYKRQAVKTGPPPNQLRGGHYCAIVPRH